MSVIIIKSCINSNVLVLLSTYRPLFIVYISGFTTSPDEFLAKLPDEYKFRPYGELLHVYRKDDMEYEVYKVK